MRCFHGVHTALIILLIVLLFLVLQLAIVTFVKLMADQLLIGDRSLLGKLLDFRTYIDFFVRCNFFVIIEQLLVMLLLLRLNVLGLLGRALLRSLTAAFDGLLENGLGDRRVVHTVPLLLLAVPRNWRFKTALFI